uniref:Putative Glycosyltransferase, family 4 n=1 Tax=mine drainage metagenome TaxID=410659 RepID=E6QHI8_9ZZZZ
MTKNGDPKSGQKGRILLLNWRDPWHPRAGGAEVVTLRVLERLHASGWEIEWFSGEYDGAPGTEVRDGIIYVRAGSAATVHAKAWWRYRGGRNGPFNLVIDQINTIPFFAPLYFKIPVVTFIHQLAREVWFYESPMPVSLIGYLAEPLYLKVYRNIPIITVSESSLTSLRQIGLKGKIYVIPEAVDDVSEAFVPTKKSWNDIIVVCRLNPSKRVDVCIRAAGILKTNGWMGTLHIVGTGSDAYVKSLKTLARKVGLDEQVCFHGRVSHQTRSELMSQSSLILLGSIREGWGLVVTESACHGTPAVVADVPGLRDSVKDGVTGRVVPATPASFASGAMEVFANLQRYSLNALNDSRQYNWDRTACDFEKVISKYVE